MHCCTDFIGKTRLFQQRDVMALFAKEDSRCEPTYSSPDNDDTEPVVLGSVDGRAVGCYARGIIAVEEGF